MARARGYFAPTRRIEPSNVGAEAFSQAAYRIARSGDQEGSLLRETGTLGKQMVDELKGLLPIYSEKSASAGGGGLRVKVDWKQAENTQAQMMNGATDEIAAQQNQRTRAANAAATLFQRYQAMQDKVDARSQRQPAQPRQPAVGSTPDYYKLNGYGQDSTPAPGSAAAFNDDNQEFDVNGDYQIPGITARGGLTQALRNVNQGLDPTTGAPVGSDSDFTTVTQADAASLPEAQQALQQAGVTLSAPSDNSVGSQIWSGITAAAAGAAAGGAIGLVAGGGATPIAPITAAAGAVVGAGLSIAQDAGLIGNSNAAAESP